MKLKTVKTIYHYLNSVNFADVLEMPTILFTRNDRVYGQQNVGIMRFNMSELPSIDAKIECVYHEMIHQYIDEYLGIDLEENDYHGTEFKKQYNKFAYNIVKDSDYDIL